MDIQSSSMKLIKEKFDYLFLATEETRIEFMPEFLYFMKLVDICAPEEMLQDFELFAKAATFVNSEEYTRIYHSHDLKRNLQKRVVAAPIIKVLTEKFEEVTWEIIKFMNYMIKVSDADFTVLRKFELTSIFKQME
jgi:hypothetical protein